MMKHVNYDKINTIFKRDQKTKKIIEGDYSTIEFEYLKDCKFRAEEKIDGTNIQIRFDGNNIEFGGRTDRAEIPAHLAKKLVELFSVEKLKETFPDLDSEKPSQIIIFGEGYGRKIQKCGSAYIKDDVSFIMFDVMVDGLWLRRDAVEDIAGKLGVDVVPVIGHMTFAEAVDLVRKGFVSIISEDKDLIAEGLVLKTDAGLLDRRGNRIIAKIKHRDFN